MSDLGSVPGAGVSAGSETAVEAGDSPETSEPEAVPAPAPETELGTAAAGESDPSAPWPTGAVPTPAPWELAG